MVEDVRTEAIWAKGDDDWEQVQAWRFWGDDNTGVKIHGTVPLTSVHFTECKSYLNKKGKLY